MQKNVAGKATDTLSIDYRAKHEISIRTIHAGGKVVEAGAPRALDCWHQMHIS
jgi:hypothetical protein